MTILPLGDAALAVEFDKDTSPEIRARIRAFCQHLQARPFKGFLKAIPAFASVTILYDAFRLSCDDAYAAVSTMLLQTPSPCASEYRVIEIPVCYSETLAPDLRGISAYLKLTVQELIDLHAAALYEVAMIGFVPAFPYLAGLSEKLYAPRHAAPRLSVPAGSVGIAGKQTGIYPFETPGGWQLIGRTPIKLFRPTQMPPTLLRGGDRVRFRPISEDEFFHFSRQEHQ